MSRSKKTDEEIQAEMMRTLERLADFELTGVQSAIVQLKQRQDAMEADSASLRDWLIRTTQRAGQRAVPAIRRALFEADPAVRAAAVLATEGLGESAHDLDSYLELMEEPTPLAETPEGSTGRIWGLQIKRATRALIREIEEASQGADPDLPPAPLPIRSVRQISPGMPRMPRKA